MRHVLLSVIIKSYYYKKYGNLYKVLHANNKKSSLKYLYISNVKKLAEGAEGEEVEGGEGGGGERGGGEKFSIVINTSGCKLFFSLHVI